MLPLRGCWCRDEAQLCEKPQLVVVAPALSDPAVAHAVEGDARHECLLAGGWNAHQIAEVRAATRPSDHHQIALGQHVVDGHLQVRERRAPQLRQLFQALVAVLQVRRCRMVDEVGGHKLVDHREIAGGAEGFLVDAANDRFGLMMRHGLASFPVVSYR